MNIKKAISILLSTIMIFSLSACSEEEKTEEKDKIITTSYITYQLTKEVVGDTADVVFLNKQEGEEIESKDLKEIRSSSFIIYEGEELQPWVDNILRNELKDLNIKTINAADGIKLSNIIYDDNLFVSTTFDQDDNKNEDLQDSLFESSTEEIPSEEITSELNSDESESNSKTTEVTTSSESSEEIIGNEEYENNNIRTYLEGLNLYDVVEYFSPIRGYLYDTKNASDLKTVDYEFEGKTYTFAYSQNYDSFFYLGEKTTEQPNAFTDNFTDDYYWFNINNVEIMALNIKEGINGITEKHSSIRNQNYTNFLDELEDLKEVYNKSIEKDSILILGCEYIPGTIIETYELKYSTPYRESIISDRDKENYCKYLKMNNANCSILTVAGDETAAEISEETGLKTATLNLNDDIEKSYIEYMNENLEIIKDCIL